MGGARPQRQNLVQFVGRGVDDVSVARPRLLIVGINPGLWTAAVNAPFAYPGNRFWPSLAEAGLTPWRVDASAGLAAADEQMLADQGIAVTNLVNRATARASELGRAELAAGWERIERLMVELRPPVTAVLGITAYRQARGERRAQLGRQADCGQTQLWVLPQPSGLNAHAPLPVLVRWWQQVGQAAGIPGVTGERE